MPDATDTWERRLASWSPGAPAPAPAAGNGQAPSGLSDAERLVWDAYPTGAWVDLGPGEADDSASWGPERHVRAEVLAQLLLGAREPEAGKVPALRLAGAVITGRLQLAGGRVEAMLRLSRCRLEEIVFITEAETRRIRITDCVLPGLEATGVRVDGYLSLSGCTINGQVRLARASINSGLRLNGTLIDNGDSWAIFAGALTVDGGTYGLNCRLTGGARLSGARLGGGLFLQGASVTSSRRFALLADNIVVEDIMECSRGFTAEGEVRMRGARVNGTLSFDDATLRAHPGSRALTLSRSDTQELIIRPAEQITGRLSLTGARTGALLCDLAESGTTIHMNGFVYDALRPHDLPVTRRLAALTLHTEGFSPQPYEQLAEWYRRTGREDLARRTQLAKQRARRSTLSPGGRAIGYTLDWTVGYGYRAWQAVAWTALLAAVGTTIFSIQHPTPLKPPTERPAFHAFIYTLDLMLPISTFGQRDLWDPTSWTRWLAYALTAGGWIIITAVIAGATRVLRPN